MSTSDIFSKKQGTESNISDGFLMKSSEQLHMHANKFNKKYKPKQKVDPSSNTYGSKYYHKKYPPPNQIFCTISASNVFKFCQYYWLKNNVDKIKDLLEAFRIIRKSIMKVGFDENPSEINKDIMSEVENINTINNDKIIDSVNEISKDFPDYLESKQILPTESVKFDPFVWFLIFRAMLPVITFKKEQFTRDTFDILFNIYTNVITSEISRKYEIYIKESNAIFDKKAKKFGGKFAHNFNVFSTRVNTYSQSIQEYRQLKNEYLDKSVNSFQNFTKELDVSDIDNYKIAGIWILITFNPLIIQPKYGIINNTLKLFPTTASSKYISNSDKIESIFNKENPTFTIKECTEQQWIDRLYIYLYGSLMKNIMYLSKSDKNKDDLIEYDHNMITIIQNFVLKSDYEIYKNNKQAHAYFGIREVSVEQKINFFLNKLVSHNFPILINELKNLPTKNVIYEVLTNFNQSMNGDYLMTYNIISALFEDKTKDKNIINEIYREILEKYKSTERLKKYIPELISLVYYINGFSDIKTEIANNSDIESQILLYLFKFRETDIKKYNTIKSFTKDRARYYISILLGKEKYTLMDIIDDSD